MRQGQCWPRGGEWSVHGVLGSTLPPRGEPVVVECRSHRPFSRVKRPPGLRAGLTGASGPQSQAAKVRLHPSRCPLFLERTPRPCRSCTRNLPCPNAPHPNPGMQRSRAGPRLKPRPETWKEVAFLEGFNPLQVLLREAPGAAITNHHKLSGQSPKSGVVGAPPQGSGKVLPASSSPWGLQLPWL